MSCAAEGCDKTAHMMCYQGFVLKKHNELETLPPGQVACTKKCHLKAFKAAKTAGKDPDGGNRKGDWDCDGLNGLDDPKTSVKILLDWWMAEGNYSKFRGKNNQGIKEKQFADQPCAPFVLWILR